MIIDFVPNHVARQYKSICKPKGVKDLGEDDNVQCGFDPAHNNFYYCPGQSFLPYFDLYHGEQEPYKEEPAKATGNDCFTNAPGQNDWYETVKLNYGVDYYAGGTGHFDPMPDTWKKMTDILLFWASKGVDAFRCDMAEMVPAAFWSYATGEVKARYPEVKFIGEVYNPNEYRNYIAAGFDYLYDKVGMYDVLRDIVCHRRGTGDITHAWQHTDDIRQHMLYFLENHDEQRIASDYFAGDGFKAVPALIVAALMERNPFMLYAGQEYGERGMDEEGFSGRDGRTTIFDYWSVDTLTRAAEGRLTEEEQSLARIYNKVLAIAQKEKAVTEGEMFDLMYANQQYGAQYAFLRSNGKSVLLVAVNFDDTAAEIHLTIPAHAFDYLGIEEADYTAKDLITDKELPLSMKRDGQVTVTLQPRGGVVCKF